MDNLYPVLALAVAGPVLGSLIGVLKKPSNLVMYNMLSFAAGIMLSISFLNLIPESIALSSVIISCIGIVTGALIMYTLDKLIPHIHPGLMNQEQGCNLEKTATYLIFGIFLHNIPEGMAIAAGNVTGSVFLISLAIAIHNIPEGICTSAPYYACNGKRLRSFLISSATAIPLIVGFFLAKVLYAYISNSFIGFTIAATAGVMIYISADELIPTSCHKLDKWSHSIIFSLITGVIFVVLLAQL